MLQLLLLILFCALAGVAKSVADTLQHHFSVSIFSKKNPKWWDPSVSWKYVKFLPLTKYRPDAWHLANSAMILLLILAAVFHKPVINWYWEVAIAGTAFVIPLNVFYNKILIV